MIKVVNAHEYNGPGYRIHRPSIFGNPYSHKPGTLAQYRVSTRRQAVTKYEQWLDEQIESGGEVAEEFNRLVAQYKRDGELVLICFCAPLECHGFVIKNRILDCIEDSNPNSNFTTKD